MVSTVNANIGWKYKNIQPQAVRSPPPSQSQTAAEKFSANTKSAITKNMTEDTAAYATKPDTFNSKSFAAIAGADKMGATQNADSYADSTTNTAQSETSQKASRTLSTSKGQMAIDLDEYFSGKPGPTYHNLTDVPLLLPSADNITALSQHASARFNDMLKKHGIPEAPEQITFDHAGKMKFPIDYAYADELTLAFEETPGLERELSTVNALTSHYVEIQKSAPFREAYAKATTQAAVDAILDKYAYLFQDNGNYSQIALAFSDDGSLHVTANGNPVSLD